MGYFNCKNLEKNKEAKDKIKLVYECVGTEEENQEKIDDIFDYIFEIAIKKEGNDLGLLTSIDKM